MVDGSKEMNLLNYVMEFREKLVKVNEIAKVNLKTSQEAMKARCDRSSVERNFLPGEKVLALLAYLVDHFRHDILGLMRSKKKLVI